jgi:hypothetical protein
MLIPWRCRIASHRRVHAKIREIFGSLPQRLYDGNAKKYDQIPAYKKWRTFNLSFDGDLFIIRNWSLEWKKKYIGKILGENHVSKIKFTFVCVRVSSDFSSLRHVSSFPHSISVMPNRNCQRALWEGVGNTTYWHGRVMEIKIINYTGFYILNIDQLSSELTRWL